MGLFVGGSAKVSENPSLTTRAVRGPGTGDDAGKTHLVVHTAPARRDPGLSARRHCDRCAMHRSGWSHRLVGARQKAVPPHQDGVGREPCWR